VGLQDTALDHGITVVAPSGPASHANGTEKFTAMRHSVLLPDTSGFPLGRAFVADHCANCLSPLLEETEILFCSEWCKETAVTVRYLRGTSRDGRIDDPDVKQAIDIRLAFIMAGSYSALGRELSPTTRAEVKERDGGLCQSCGRPGAEIDHISGSSGDLLNLQLLCNECHRAKTMENMVSAPDEEKALIARLFLDRVFPDTPKLLADDEGEWKGIWMALKKERRQRLLDEIESIGISLKGMKSRAAWIAKRDSVMAERVPEEVGAGDGGQASGEFEWGFGEGSYLDRL
jgi:hypothetical protein